MIIIKFKQKKNWSIIAIYLHLIKFIINYFGANRMGIYKLMDIIRSHAPDAIRKRELKYYTSMTVALDASMSMYQFLVSTQGVSSDSNFLT